jgi:hypothetical protein
MRTPLLALTLLAATSSVAQAEALVLEPSSPNLAPTGFDYRYDSTRTWLIGCFGVDWLHGAAIFPKTWNHSANFTPADGDYRAAFQPTWLERFCAAQLGIYNYVQVAWTDPSDATHVLRGVIQVDAGGTSKVDEVTCTLVDETSPFDAIQCEQAVVNLAGREDTYVIVHLEGLD